MNVSLGRGQANASAAGIDFRRPSDITQVHTAAAGRNLHLAITLAHFDAPAARLNGCALRARLDGDRSSAGFCDDLAVGVMHLNRPATRVQPEIAAHRPDTDRS